MDVPYGILENRYFFKIWREKLQAQLARLLSKCARLLAKQRIYQK